MTPAQTLIAHNVARWNQLAGTLRCTFPLDSFLDHEWFGKRDSVLDFGCGTGRALSILHNKLGVADLWGCDSSSKMCVLARQNNPHSTIVQVPNPEIAPKIKHRFTRTLLVGVMSSIISTKCRLALLKTIQPLLRRSGLLLAGDFGSPNSAEYRSRYASIACEPTTFQTAEGLYIHHFVEGEIEELLRRVGFTIVKSMTLPVTTVHGKRLPGYVVIARTN